MFLRNVVDFQRTTRRYIPEDRIVYVTILAEVQLYACVAQNVRSVTDLWLEEVEGENRVWPNLRYCRAPNDCLRLVRRCSVYMRSATAGRKCVEEGRPVQSDSGFASDCSSYHRVLGPSAMLVKLYTPVIFLQGPGKTTKTLRISGTFWIRRRNSVHVTMEMRTTLQHFF
jgi:hypothetical protein